MSIRLATALLFLGFSASAGAQTLCPPGTAEAKLRGADVEATLFTNGNLFYGNTVVDGGGYLVPMRERGGDQIRSALYAGQLWVAGLVGGGVRETADQYGFSSFRPGATGPDGIPPDSTACAAADRIWMVGRSEIEQYYRTGGATPDLADWPVAQGAPVLDGDGDLTNYNLAGGDQPAIRGDVMAWWSMTDLAAQATFPSPDLTPVGVDVAMEAVAFRSASPVLATTTMYRATITNRSGQQLDSAYAALFLDFDIGDNVGSDTTNEMFFTYRADENYRDGYGSPAPAFGALVAEGPVASPNGKDDDADGQVDEAGERAGLAASMIWYNENGPRTDPHSAGDYYHAVRGMWLDGKLQREAGEGYPYDPQYAPMPTIYPGDPTTSAYWSAMNPNGTGVGPFESRRRRGVFSTGPFRLAPNESTNVTFALIYARGSDRWDSVRLLRSRASIIRSLAASGALEPLRVARDPGTIPEPELSVRRPSPNPFRGSTTIQLTGPPDASLRVSVIDVLGREVVAPTEHVLGVAPTELALGAGLGPGTYIVRVTVPAGERSFVVTKLR